MFSFVKNFLNRGYIALFSYFSWQVQISKFTRLFITTFTISVTFLLIAIIL